MAAILACEKVTGLTLTVHDHRGILADESGIPLIYGRQFHNNRYCLEGRYQNTVRGWDARCLGECAERIEAESTRDYSPYVHHCWKGAAELIVPILHNDTLCLILYAGVFRGKERPVEDRMVALYEALPPIPEREDLRRFACLLRAFGLGLIELRLCGKKGRHELPLRKARIWKYIEKHAHGDASMKGLAADLCLSVSRTRHLVTLDFGMSFQKLLLLERLNRTKCLLAGGDSTLKEIAAAVGWSNEYYLSRRFKQFFGIPPGAWRRENRLGQ